ncbi:branched-chain amino acid transport system substrate-binding protein [Dehalogenimonas formicexedens]|uniref:Branched-chain amino acid transport system substrate-binding protein n=1 Tax=Dehalogenimonas formicexedens TaxID=1839801 RepID=A0A1P8FAJ8_9CHLR|nr:ABC transporter substrate-binding protein [Dehalogenimonas formicexedens]APV45479.1 branched-chain amino acid transport system substrate-binding protein [Dehalogenimonas formicexedens]
MFKKAAILLLTLVMAVTFAACGSGNGNTTPSGTTQPPDVNLGVVMDISGALSGIGGSLVKSIQLAVEQANNAGGINGAKIKLFIEDGKTDPAAGFEAIKKLGTINNCKVIIGPMISGAVMSSGQWALDNKVLLISPSATSPDIAQQAWRQFFIRTATTDDIQGKAMAKIITDAGTNKKVAFMVQNNQYGVGIANAVTASLAGKATIVSTIKYDPTKLDYLSELQQIKAAAPDFIVHAGYEDDAIIVFKQAAQLGLGKPIQWITSEGVKAAKTLTDAQAAAFMAQSVVGTNPVSQGTLFDTFKAAYKAKYNEEPGTYNDTVYDATNLAIAAMKQAGTNDSAKIAAAVLTIGQNYAGVSGPITFNQYGDRTSATFEEWGVVQNGSTYTYTQIKLITS